MAGLVPAIHAEVPRIDRFERVVGAANNCPTDKGGRHETEESGLFPKISARLGVDGRDKPGHDGLGDFRDVCMR